MSSIFGIPFGEAVRSRRSVRTYSAEPVGPKIRQALRDYIPALSNPFGAKVAFRLFACDGGGCPGTSGMIKGRADYIGSFAEKTELALEGIGYEFEQLILYATTLGLGTCWLGGTFDKKGFAEKMDIGENELFPAVSPFGYPAKMSLKESMTRTFVGADRRKPQSELFFDGSFTAPLSEAGAGPYAFPLEMTRLAPSASNKQPWRVVKSGRVFHFYEYRTPGYSSRFPYDIQRLDMGIAACHFHLSALEKDLKGKWKQFDSPLSPLPENVRYAFSWEGE